MLPGQTDCGREMNLTHAAKLTRANAAQVEALAKHRNKGKQKITIEHVHVYQGGQAAFIANGTPGGGRKNRKGSRHKSVDTLRGYVRDAELFKDHAGAGLL
jgi:hypothetical protein